MAGTTKYKNQWQSENRERINFVLPKRDKAIIKSAVDKAGASLGGYIINAIKQRLKNEEQPFLC